jgi:hypothetical protein
VLIDGESGGELLRLTPAASKAAEGASAKGGSVN